MSHVTCHQRQQPQQQTLHLLTPPLCTLALFAKTEICVFGNHPIYPKTPKKIQTQKMVQTFHHKREPYSKYIELSYFSHFLSMQETNRYLLTIVALNQSFKATIVSRYLLVSCMQ